MSRAYKEDVATAGGVQEIKVTPPRVTWIYF